MQPRILEAIAAERPDWTLVYGDTASTLAGARAASEAGVPLAHVESGMRSGDWSMPEEHIRDRRSTALSTLLLCPDERSARQLEREGVEGRIEVVGDVMADASLPPRAHRARALDDPRPARPRPGSYVVATVHREANVGSRRLGRIVDGLNRLTSRSSSPRTLARARRSSASDRARAARSPLQPLGYLDLAALASRARVILTDSGGLQKEAYWYGVPCVTLRPSTEWVDTVELGANALVDDDPDRIERRSREARHAGEPPAALRRRARVRTHCGGALYACAAMTDVNVAVVGLGYWGPNLARNFDDLARLSWICDASEEQLARTRRASPRPARRRLRRGARR